MRALRTSTTSKATAAITVAVVLLLLFPATTTSSGPSGSGDPSVAWTRVADYSLGGWDGLYGTCVLGDGNALATGLVSTSTVGFTRVFVRKYRSSDGSTIWTKLVNGDAPGSYNIGNGAAACPDGNAVVVGTVSMNTSGPDLCVRKYRSSDGSTIWTRRVDGGYNTGDEGLGVAVGPDGNPVVAGYVCDALWNRHIWIRKYNGTDGSTIWTRRVSAGGSRDAGHGVGIGPEGNPVIAGRVTAGPDDHWLAWKLKGTDGATIWRKEMAIDSMAFGAAVDRDGNAFVTGLDDAGSAEKIYTRKYRGADGATLWSKSYTTGHGSNYGSGVALDPAGNPFVVGAAGTAAWGSHIWIRQYSGTDGATLWTDTYHSGSGGTNSGMGIAVDWAGNVFAAGSAASHAGDLWMRKYASGTTYTHPTWYLAEGSTAWGYSEQIAIENPNAAPVTARITYMTSGGPVDGGDLPLAAMSQTLVNPMDVLGAQDFSTKVECLEGRDIAVDRMMAWVETGGTAGDIHSSIGVTAPDREWYLAEGSSAWGFECWLLIQNPNAAVANCQVTYMIEGSGPVTVNKTVPANSRATFDISADIGARDASIKVAADVPVIPERAMYRNNRREGHDSIGTTTPSADYYLAEGTTAWGFTTYVLIQNPNPTATDVTVTYMTPSGPNVQPAFSMPANSRKTIRVNDVLPDTDLSTKVHGSQPIIAERAMYWNWTSTWNPNADGKEACHDSIGMSAPHRRFFLPDGEVSTLSTSTQYETWTLVQNPNDTAVDVQIAYLRPGGVDNVVFGDIIPANSRKTYNMVDRIPIGTASILVTSMSPGKGIMVERAMYFGGREGGSSTIGGYSDY